ncbi:inositol-3-phosphate synthase [Longimicrobium sp.]|uniref:inositol-3-phosphate synthase n=1 Tax=Longimicrobium sp. TaxID=2029185 RepID=UPI003B3A79C8
MEHVGEHSADRLGVLLVGALGMTGTAVMGGIIGIRNGVVHEEYGTTSHPIFASTPLQSAKSMVVGGWDYMRTPSRSVREYGHLPPAIIESICEEPIQIYPGLWTPFEYPLRDDQQDVRLPTSLKEGAAMVSSDIELFRSTTGCNRVVVVFVGTPSRDTGSIPSLGALAEQQNQLLPSGLMYAFGAANAGAHFIDFTPSNTLEYQDLWSYAESKGVQIVGRDGSTGQTMMKVTLAEMLSRRGIRLEAWYSTNLIGNRDGLVLSHPEYSVPKLADKTDSLQAVETGFHRVRIEYCPPWGDSKEAWDAIECRTWLGAPLSIRVDWRGHDSQLAGAVILDLIRLVDRGASIGHSGFRPQLGFFFKRPFLRESTTISERWAELIETYAR